MESVSSVNAFANFVLIGWIPIVFILFLSLPRRTALLTSIVAGWLFLPVTHIRIAGLPDYSKVSATSLAPLIAALVLDWSRFLRFRPGWRDLPVFVLCISPLLSSLANDLGAYDGFASVFAYTCAFGVPYFLGRVYLRDDQGVRHLADLIVTGGLVYVPLCLFEIRMSPQLHRMVYGVHQHSFEQTARAGGWRPDVFMNHGLMVAFWMMAASLLALVLTRTRVVRVRFGVPAGWCAAALVVTFLLCKSAGAIVLLAIGWLVAWLARRRQAGWLVWVLLLTPPAYVAGRVSGVIDRKSVDRLVEPFPAERVESLDFRLRNEDPMVARALLQPLLGWGGWGRSRIVDEEGVDVSISDSLWIEHLGRNGLVGLGALLLLLFVGPFTFLQRFRPGLWLKPDHAPAFGVMLVVVLFAVDCTVNAMVNPVYLVAIGALVSLPRPKPAPRRSAPLHDGPDEEPSAAPDRSPLATPLTDA